MLDDHVVDLLLDSAALGMNIVEREGISFSHPSRYILVGTMNPEEGDLRPQLLDRFALSVDIRGLSDPDDRVMIMERNLAFESDPVAFRAAWDEQERALSQQIAAGRELIDKVTYSDDNLQAIAALTSSLRVDGHRADLVILKSATAQAAFEGRLAINQADIARAAELALPHRLRKGLFQQSEIKLTDLEQRLEQLHSQGGATSQADPDASEQQEPAPKKVSARA